MHNCWILSFLNSLVKPLFILLHSKADLLDEAVLDDFALLVLNLQPIFFSYAPSNNSLLTIKL